MRTHLLIVAALLLAACGKFPNYNDEVGQALPANFPKDVFLPKDYSVRSSMEVYGELPVELVAPGKSNDVLARPARRCRAWAGRDGGHAGGESTARVSRTTRRRCSTPSRTTGPARPT